MDLSIIIPCHNSGQVITPLLVSLSNQVFYNYDVEIIFVIDTKEDNTSELINLYLNEGRYNWKIYQVKECPVGVARNFGYSKSSGDYIWFVDSDDWLVDNFAVKKIIDTIKNEKIETFLKLNFVYPKFFKYYTCNMMVWEYVFNRDFIGDIKFSTKTQDEDVEFMTKVLNKMGYSITDKISAVTLQDPVYFYNYFRWNSAMTKRITELRKTKNSSSSTDANKE